ncbi:MAG: TonB family protein [Proteobacteria bacterium]|nr:TonB family protein [Pseudomonadota bacterium]
MRRGVLLSLLLHIALVFVLWVNLPAFLIPEEKITYINVTLVSSPDAAKTTKKQEIKPVKTQQSNAPREAPKPKKEQVQTPDHGTKVVSTQQSSKKTQVKKQEAKKQQKQEKKVSEIRPPKLDKTPDKKPTPVSKKEPPKEKTEDDFLKALSFIDDLKNKKEALEEGEETDTKIFDVDQQDIAVLKRHIEKNWFRPPGIKGLNDMSVAVLVSVNRDGSILKMELTHSSGQPFFDNSLLRAVRKSVPLPIPADKYDMFKTIELRFNG